MTAMMGVVPVPVLLALAVIVVAVARRPIVSAAVVGAVVVMAAAQQKAGGGQNEEGLGGARNSHSPHFLPQGPSGQASCRARVVQYWLVRGVAVSLKKKQRQ